jgi:hypothetical protein
MANPKLLRERAETCRRAAQLKPSRLKLPHFYLLDLAAQYERQAEAVEKDLAAMAGNKPLKRAGRS